MNSQDETLKISDEVSDALETFLAIQNYFCFMALRYLPLVILLLAVEEVIIAKYPLADYPM
ncbi:MAG: hypothetical protein PHW87_13375, partial [Methanothrix sp.]|nr:hypothetical protein [Methanothrix sp.]